jgi:hypothetical protein
MDQLGSAHAGEPRRQGRARTVLDLFVHQLAAHAALSARLVGKVRRSRVDTGRRPFSGVRIREGRCQRTGSGARKFGNDSWPALYLFDGQGHIRHHRAGEGEYERVEALLRQLLQETGAKELGREVGSVEGHGPELEADWANLRTPETYLGFARARNFVSPNPVAAGQLLTFTAPTGMALNSWALAGVWSIQRESVVSHQPFARIAFRFHARDVHVVMGPAIAGTSVKFRVRIDGQALRGRHGVDVDEHGSGLLNARRMYHLVRQSHPIADRDFEIEFLDPGAAAYSFTFG